MDRRDGRKRPRRGGMAVLQGEGGNEVANARGEAVSRPPVAPTTADWSPPPPCGALGERAAEGGIDIGVCVSGDHLELVSFQ